MVVSMEKDVYFVSRQQRMDGHLTVLPFLLENVISVEVASAPLRAFRGLDATPCFRRAASDQVMDKDEFEVGPAVFKSLPEPLILVRSEGPVPAVAIRIQTGRCVPELIENKASDRNPLCQDCSQKVKDDQSMTFHAGIYRHIEIRGRQYQSLCFWELSPDTAFEGRE
jgi:hypothetical protein